MGCHWLRRGLVASSSADEPLADRVNRRIDTGPPVRVRCSGTRCASSAVVHAVHAGLVVMQLPPCARLLVAAAVRSCSRSRFALSIWVPLVCRRVRDAHAPKLLGDSWCVSTRTLQEWHVHSRCGGGQTGCRAHPWVSMLSSRVNPHAHVNVGMAPDADFFGVTCNSAQLTLRGTAQKSCGQKRRKRPFAQALARQHVGVF